MPVKSKEDYHMNHYEYRLFEYEGDWVCAFPDLPGCSGIGDTPEKALADGEIAKSLWLEDYFDENGLYPVAKNRYSKGYNGKILLRTSKSMHRDLVLMAEDENVTLNALCTQLLAEGLGRKQAAQTVHFNMQCR
jgi:antitoxin HicB